MNANSRKCKPRFASKHTLLEENIQAKGTICHINEIIQKIQHPSNVLHKSYSVTELKRSVFGASNRYGVPCKNVMKPTNAQPGQRKLRSVQKQKILREKMFKSRKATVALMRLSKRSKSFKSKNSWQRLSTTRMP